MVDLVFVSMENWDEVWRRNQFVVAGLARRHPRTKILFVGLPRDLSHAVRRGRLRLRASEATWTVPGLPNVTVTRPLKLFPNSIGWGRRLNELLVRQHVLRLTRQLDIRHPVLWLNPHYALHMAGRLGERAVIYDITDDWTSLTQSPRLRRLVARQDAELCRRADAVIVCSQRLLELKRGVARNLHLVPNGVDAEHYRTVLDGSKPLPQEAAGWRRPVLGYTGTVHPDRIDVQLLEAAARQMSEATFALVGPNFLTAGDVQRLRNCGNVYLTGPVPYDRVPDYMRAFDVCITPHRVTPFTESLNPIKLWEYLAAGRPIVATAVAGFRDYPQFVRLVAGAEEFVRAAREALAEPLPVAELRREEARRHGWESRVQRIERIVHACGGTA